MDEIKLFFTSLFAKRFLASILSKRIARCCGVDVSILFEQFELTTAEDGNVRLKVRGEATMTREQMRKLMEMIEAKA